MPESHLDPLTPEILARARRLSLTVEDLGFIIAGLSLSLADASASEVEKITPLLQRMVASANEERDPDHRRITDAYRNAVDPKDGETEIDHDAEVSRGDDPGAYVMVWTWVDASDAGLCNHCNGELDDGEGYDGLCGSCADKREQEDDNGRGQ